MTFEVSHETLYLAVKLVDHYLMEVICKRDKLQLIGSTAFLIAAKFEVSLSPQNLERTNQSDLLNPDTYIYVYVYVCICRHVYVYMHVYRVCMCICVYVYTHIHMCVYVCIYLYLCVCLQLYTHTNNFFYQFFVCSPQQGSRCWVSMVVCLFLGINKVLPFPLRCVYVGMCLIKWVILFQASFWSMILCPPPFPFSTNPSPSRGMLYCTYKKAFPNLGAGDI